jgi:hypothetical protein
MSDTQVSVAARQLSRSRWGASKPTRLAHELAARLDELPEVEKRHLLDALTRNARR